MSTGKSKRKSKKDETIEFLENAIVTNTKAFTEGPKRKNYTIHNLKSIKGKTIPQNSMIESYFTGNNIITIGSAGTGKTYISLWLALNSILSNESEQDTLVIVRSAVPTRDIGFLPGSAEEKLEAYENPYKDIFNDLLGPGSYDTLKSQGKVKFVSTSFLRGLTWDNSVIFIDEIQSCTLHELNTVMTRCGDSSRIIAIGDTVQNDLIYKKNDQSGIKEFLEIARLIDEMDVITFSKHDIVRSRFVKAWLTAYEDIISK